MNGFLLLDEIVSLPNAARAADADAGKERFLLAGSNSGEAELQAFVTAFLKEPKGERLLAAIFGNSPYLTRVILQQLPFFRLLCTEGVARGRAALEQFLDAIAEARHEKTHELMDALRGAKAKAALLTAVADIGGVWGLKEVTHCLSDTADRCIDLGCAHLLQLAVAKGEIAPVAGDPCRESGLIVLGMGKLGARELNYSSDIDLIILFDKERIDYCGKQSVQHCFSRIAQELVRILQERTETGYVFRTDLRLRPDPGSTPPAMSTGAAITYYETVGQNWERAALIKARPVAGDIAAGERFLKDIAPFIWRKHLDFAAIEDIQSIKRQMNARLGMQIALPGHNIKTGPGGIREIEFYAQIHQLIWGGRNPELRHRMTLVTLRQLAALGIIGPHVSEELSMAYLFLRRVEHRLQMVDDQQTHTLPQHVEQMAGLAAFLGFESEEAFKEEMVRCLHYVHEVFAGSFQGTQSLGDEGNLVFTGVEADTDTLKTLEGMGYRNTQAISDVVQGWHRGRARATRNKRARELLTEIMPALLKALANNANPDTAFMHFDAFLQRLPAGVQLFSLFINNPTLLALVATIMGSAPALAETISRNPSLLDSVLAGAYLTAEQEEAQLAKMIAESPDFEGALRALRQFKHEREFQAGVGLLKQETSVMEMHKTLTRTAEITLEHLLRALMESFEKDYGRIAGGSFGILGMGKLGAQEMTYGSDLDLVMVYALDDAEARSDGARSVSPNIYYNRLAQRLVGALNALGSEGRLYEVDTRLRPSGSDLAVSLPTLNYYFDQSAWTFEFMALSRARAVAGDISMKAELQQFIQRQLCKHRTEETLRKDIAEMRRKVEAQYHSDNPWNVKYVRGGLMDLDFIAQYYLLLHAENHPLILSSSSREVFAKLEQEGCVGRETCRQLEAAAVLQDGLLSLLRLCAPDEVVEAAIPPGLRHLIAQHLGEPDLSALKARLFAEQAFVGQYFVEHIECL